MKLLKIYWLDMKEVAKCHVLLRFRNKYIVVYPVIPLIIGLTHSFQVNR
jgi:hypothetical protein|uniref:Uncharacterized protein n=1 Tax=Picea glauca TaxID=3330 RepID=A0A101LW76_PICGL|nr:hypothetical protein ABT39_MTgene1571 [Picea glauca]